jgi:LemA protein
LNDQRWSLEMNGTVIFGSLLALGLFWSIGAYNRLMRLRSQAIAGFVAVDQQLKRYIDLGRLNFQDIHPEQLPDWSSVWDGLRGALAQLEASLKAARTQPLDALAMGALQTAQDTLHTSWARVVNGPVDLAGAPLPEPMRLQWDDIARQTAGSCAEFNRLLVLYNDAIAQFPARILAWLFGFRTAKMLQAST